MEHPPFQAGSAHEGRLNHLDGSSSFEFDRLDGGRSEAVGSGVEVAGVSLSVEEESPTLFDLLPSSAGRFNRLDDRSSFEVNRFDDGRFEAVGLEVEVTGVSLSLEEESPTLFAMSPSSAASWILLNVRSRSLLKVRQACLYDMWWPLS